MRSLAAVRRSISIVVPSLDDSFLLSRVGIDAISMQCSFLADFAVLRQVDTAGAYLATNGELHDVYPVGVQILVGRQQCNLARETMFSTPKGTDPVAIDLGSMGKGQAWVNGHLIGRYWSLVAPESGCSSSCYYPGAYNERKCQSNCGMPTQNWYHIPREWLKESDNLLVLFEETGGDPSLISLEAHYAKTVCSRISENYYPPLSAWSHLSSGRASVNAATPELRLQCDDGHVISEITFASYGTPSGGCLNFSKGNCHASSTLDLVTEACVGNTKCAISVSNDVFGDPCRGVLKDLAVEAKCSPPSTTKEPRGEM
ncbi:hypothetical protein OsJ_35926 [Oryza sativa Japonica Group]|uniref:beta-galactosidase n=1 Tax=Oryza sativa subsp. japonica TaxID=39947 RepID=B9GCX1_ORYSJ|nr:hypothetical protein OsJ_35926 [Oryza sativa Japonica Group]